MPSLTNKEIICLRDLAIRSRECAASAKEVGHPSYRLWVLERHGLAEPLGFSSTNARCWTITDAGRDYLRHAI